MIGAIRKLDGDKESAEIPPENRLLHNPKEFQEE
jgi:hypothetical protein